MFKVNDIIKNKDNGKCYRVEAVKGGTAALCEMDTNTLVIAETPCNALAIALDEGRFKIMPEEPAPVFDPGALPESVRNEYEKRLSCIKELEAAYGPGFVEMAGKKQKPEAEAIRQKYGFKPNTFRRLIVRYLQSGKKKSSLVDGRSLVRERGEYNYVHKPGRKASDGLEQGKLLTPADHANFDDGIRYMKTGHGISLRKAFDYINDLYYRTPSDIGGIEEYRLLPESERPTFWQFYDHAKAVLSEKDKAVIRTSEAEFRNDRRPLLSREGYRVHGPGDLAEIDACEVDISLRSDEARTVGRPTVYFMLDVFSMMILAVSIAFDVNSWIGLSNLFINLGEDKIAYCAKYGIGFTDPSVWPAGILPRRVRMDRGSDMTCDEMRRVCSELNIEMQNVSGASGSLKGGIEQAFHQLHSELNAHFVHCGLIEDRHDSKHHREAALDVRAYTKAVIAFVLEHNRQYFETYDLTPDMVERGVRPIPAEIWRYGVEKYGQPDTIPDPEQYFFNLLTPASAKITRRGIVWEGRYYMADDDGALPSRMVEAGRGNISFGIRYDPRSVDEVYYVSGGRLITAPLNERMPGNAGFKGMTRGQCMEIAEKKRKMDKRGTVYDEELHAYTDAVLNTIVDDAKSVSPSYSDARGIKDARAAERARVEDDYGIAGRIADARGGDPARLSADDAGDANDVSACSIGVANRTDAAVGCGGYGNDYSAYEDVFLAVVREEEEKQAEKKCMEGNHGE